MLAIQTGICIAGIGVLSHVSAIVGCGIFVAAAIILPLLFLVLAARDKQLGMAKAARVLAIAAGIVTTIAIGIVTAFVLLMLFIYYLFAGADGPDDHPTTIFLVSTTALLVIAGCCSIAAAINSANATAVKAQDGAPALEREATA